MLRAMRSWRRLTLMQRWDEGEQEETRGQEEGEEAAIAAAARSGDSDRSRRWRGSRWHVSYGRSWRTDYPSVVRGRTVLFMLSWDGPTARGAVTS